jgi:hypothetical protein
MNKGQIQLGQFLKNFSKTFGLKKTTLLRLSNFDSVDIVQILN